MLYPFENTKNSITIVLSSYFHILEIGARHLLSYTCISKNVLKCILKHAIIQYYAMKSKIFFLLIIKVKNIHEFNLLSLSLWIFSTQKKILHWHILPCFHPQTQSLKKEYYINITLYNKMNIIPTSHIVFHNLQRLEHRIKRKGEYIVHLF